LFCKEAMCFAFSVRRSPHPHTSSRRRTRGNWQSYHAFFPPQSFPPFYTLEIDYSWLLPEPPLIRVEVDFWVSRFLFPPTVALKTESSILAILRLYRMNLSRWSVVKLATLFCCHPSPRSYRFYLAVVSSTISLFNIFDLPIFLLPPLPGPDLCKRGD